MSEIDQEEAEELLMEAVDNIATVQDGYQPLTDESNAMLRESKAGIASVVLHFDGPIQFDFDGTLKQENQQRASR